MERVDGRSGVNADALCGIGLHAFYISNIDRVLFTSGY